MHVFNMLLNLQATSSFRSVVWIDPSVGPYTLSGEILQPNITQLPADSNVHHSDGNLSSDENSSLDARINLYIGPCPRLPVRNNRTRTSHHFHHFQLYKGIKH